jgi:radical SAM protein with 4Fe4S-binding SPASM domain
MKAGFDGEWNAMSTGERIIADEVPCYAAGRNLSIMPNGDLFTCFQQSWIPRCSAPLGNIQNDHITDMLTDPYASFVSEQMSRCNLSCKVLKCNQKHDSPS